MFSPWELAVPTAVPLLQPCCCPRYHSLHPTPAAASYLRALPTRHLCDNCAAKSALSLAIDPAGGADPDLNPTFPGPAGWADIDVDPRPPGSETASWLTWTTWTDHDADALRFPARDSDVAAKYGHVNVINDPEGGALFIWAC